MCETCNVYNRISNVKYVQYNPLFLYEEEKWPLIGSLLGYDYLQWIYNCGYATIFKKVLPHLKEWSVSEAVNAIKNNTKVTMPSDYAINLEKTVNLFKYAPILSNNNQLIPLNSFNNTSIWEYEIGFNSDPSSILPVHPKFYEKAKNFDEYSFLTYTGDKLSKFEIPIYNDSYKSHR